MCRRAIIKVMKNQKKIKKIMKKSEKSKKSRSKIKKIKKKNQKIKKSKKSKKKSKKSKIKKISYVFFRVLHPSSRTCKKFFDISFNENIKENLTKIWLIFAILQKYLWNNSISQAVCVERNSFCKVNCRKNSSLTKQLFPVHGCFFR